MFGIGGFEIFIILVFVFLVFGPDKLPEITKLAGAGIRKFRKAKSEMDKVLKDEIVDPVMKEANKPETPKQKKIMTTDNAAAVKEEAKKKAVAEAKTKKKSQSETKTKVKAEAKKKAQTETKKKTQSTPKKRNTQTSSSKIKKPATKAKPKQTVKKTSTVKKSSTAKSKGGK